MQLSTGLKDVECTSKRKTLAQVDWSRQLSRDTAPFFVATAVPDPRGSMTGADAPRRHMRTVDMEKAPPREREARPDLRDYEPKTYEELHRRCGVDIGRGAQRDGGAFGGPKYDYQNVLDLEKAQPWKLAKSKFGLLGPPPKVPARGSPTPPPAARSPDPTPVHSAFAPIASTPTMLAVESRHCRPLGGIMPKKDERALTPAPDRPELLVTFNAVERHRSVPLFSLGAGRQADRKKLSESYLDKFRVPPRVTPLRRRDYGGFAPVRHSDDTSVPALLAKADAAAQRAQKLVLTNFSPSVHGAVSEVRKAMLYTPSPAASPTPADTAA